MDTKYLYKN